MTWDDVLKRADLIGGDIESVEDGDVYRGPLAEIKKEGPTIIFKSPWCARLDRKTGKWEKWHITQSSVNTAYTQPEDIGGGRVAFLMLMLGHCTLFPSGDSKLDPALVVGLELKTT